MRFATVTALAAASVSKHSTAVDGRRSSLLFIVFPRHVVLLLHSLVVSVCCAHFLDYTLTVSLPHAGHECKAQVSHRPKATTINARHSESCQITLAK